MTASNFRDESAPSPFHALLLNPHAGDFLDVIRFFLVGIDVGDPDFFKEDPNGFGQNPLHLACVGECPNLDVIRLILDTCPGATSNRDNIGETPSYAMCRKDLDAATTIAIYRLFKEKDENVLMRAVIAHTNEDEIDDGEGELPIH